MWYRFLDRKFGARQVLLKPWQKVACDQVSLCFDFQNGKIPINLCRLQLFFSPQINLIALPVLGMMNQQSMEEIKRSIRENYVEIMIANYKIWPMAQMVNFYYVPLNYR